MIVDLVLGIIFLILGMVLLFLIISLMLDKEQLKKIKPEVLAIIIIMTIFVFLVGGFCIAEYVEKSNEDRSINYTYEILNKC